MSRFYGEVEGNGSVASRMGGKVSGLRGHIRGWNLGAKVKMWVNSEGEDVCTIHLSSGSSPDLSDVLIGSFNRAALEDGLKSFKKEKR